MEIVYHIGAHETDEDRILKCLLKNRDALIDQGISVPNPARYRKLLRELLSYSLRSSQSRPDRHTILDAILGDDVAERLVMSNSNFICIPARIFERDQFYHLAATKVQAFAEIFSEDALEFHIAVRNPATFVPAVLSRLDDEARSKMLATLDPFDLRWSDVISRIREACPQAAVTVWCNEDIPLLWSQLIREISGLEHGIPIAGGFDLLAEIMNQEGYRRFLSYLKANPPQTEVQKRRIIAAFLDKFSRPDALELELDLPGWTDEVVETLTERYEEDLFTIERLHGVDFIAP